PPAPQSYSSPLHAALPICAPRAVLEPWDEALASTGALLVVARAQWVDANAEAFRRYCAAMSGGAGVCLGYRPGLALHQPAAAATVDEVAEAFLAVRAGVRHTALPVAGDAAPQLGEERLGDPVDGGGGGRW